jgi:hypothetical protein
VRSDTIRFTFRAREMKNFDIRIRITYANGKIGNPKVGGF